jgi:hypothetical protein
MLADGPFHPFVIGAIGEHELDLVVHRQMLEVRPPVALALP